MIVKNRIGDFSGQISNVGSPKLEEVFVTKRTSVLKRKLRDRYPPDSKNIHIL